jgi:hypothetical protein
MTFRFFDILNPYSASLMSHHDLRPALLRGRDYITAASAPWDFRLPRHHQHHHCWNHQTQKQATSHLSFEFQIMLDAARACLFLYFWQISISFFLRKKELHMALQTTGCAFFSSQEFS